MKLLYDFYARDTVIVAQDLLGKRLKVGPHVGIITETEVYKGADDEASHAFRGPTKRSAIMFGPAGHTYVYLIYGMYYCFNIVTEELGTPGAVLIRGVFTPDTHLDGPGKLCRSFGITKKHNGVNLVKSHDLYVIDEPCSKPYKATPRIGIRKAKDKLWRFILSPLELNGSIPSSLTN